MLLRSDPLLLISFVLLWFITDSTELPNSCPLQPETTSDTIHMLRTHFESKSLRTGQVAHAHYDSRFISGRTT